MQSLKHFFVKLISDVSKGEMIQPEYLHVLLPWVPAKGKSGIVPGNVRELGNPAMGEIQKLLNLPKSHEIPFLPGL